MKARSALRLGLVLVTGLVLWAALWWLAPQAPAVQAAGPLFAKPGGSGTACTQAAPCALPTALGKAVNGDTIYLGAGTYTGAGETVASITRSLTLLGGWNGAAGGPVARDPAAFPSLLDGEGQRRVMTVLGSVTVTLEGLTLQRGYREGDGGGLYSSGANLTLRAMTFVSNVVTTTYTTGGAGALVEDGRLLLVENSTFRRNWAYGKESSFGAGLAISDPHRVSVTNCLFADNDSWHGSGLFLTGVGSQVTSVYLSDNTFANNGRGYSEGWSSGGYAAAFAIYDAWSRIERNVIYGNHSGNDWGAVAVFGGVAYLGGNWITNNYAWQTSGLYLEDITAFTVTNNIVADNEGGPTASQAVMVKRSRGLLAHNTIARNQVETGVQALREGSARLINNILVSHTVGVSVTSGCSATLNGTPLAQAP